MIEMKMLWSLAKKEVAFQRLPRYHGENIIGGKSFRNCSFKTGHSVQLM